jgi:Zinc knuckle
VSTQGEVRSASLEGDGAKAKEYRPLPKCFNCNKVGHIKRDCKAPQNPQKGKFMGKKPSSGSYNTHNCEVEEVNETSKTEEEVNSSRAQVIKQGYVDIGVMEVQVVGQAVENSSENFNCSYGQCKNKSVEAIIQADVIAKRPYTELLIGDLPKLDALIDSGSEICCIDSKYIKGLSLPVETKVKLSGLRGQASTVDVVKLKVKKVTPDNQVNIAPPVHVWFAVVPELN